MERLLAAERQRPKLTTQGLPRFQHGGITTGQTPARLLSMVPVAASHRSFLETTVRTLQQAEGGKYRSHLASVMAVGT